MKTALLKAQNQAFTSAAADSRGAMSDLVSAVFLFSRGLFRLLSAFGNFSAGVFLTIILLFIAFPPEAGASGTNSPNSPIPLLAKRGGKPAEFREVLTGYYSPLIKVAPTGNQGSRRLQPASKLMDKNLNTRNLKVAPTGNQGSRRLQPAPNLLPVAFLVFLSFVVLTILGLGKVAPIRGAPFGKFVFNSFSFHSPLSFLLISFHSLKSKLQFILMQAHYVVVQFIGQGEINISSVLPDESGNYSVKVSGRFR